AEVHPPPRRGTPPPSGTGAPQEAGIRLPSRLLAPGRVEAVAPRSHAPLAVHRGGDLRAWLRPRPDGGAPRGKARPQLPAMAPPEPRAMAPAVPRGSVRGGGRAVGGRTGTGVRATGGRADRDGEVDGRHGAGAARQSRGCGSGRPD